MGATGMREQSLAALPSDAGVAAGGDGPSCVTRTALVRRLHGGPARRVTVLQAPAGYGKSIVVEQWLATRIGHRVANVRFRPDDDAQRVAHRMVAALQPLSPRPL